MAAIGNIAKASRTSGVVEVECIADIVVISFRGGEHRRTNWRMLPMPPTDRSRPQEYQNLKATTASLAA
jgi:hypothetical protein